LIQRGNPNGNSHDRQYNNQKEKFEDIKVVIRTVNQMTGNTMTNKKSLKISKAFLVCHCIACHVSYRSDYPFDIFKLFLLVIVLPVI
jgi:cytochrome c556